MSDDDAWFDFCFKWWAGRVFKSIDVERAVSNEDVSRGVLPRGWVT